VDAICIVYPFRGRKLKRLGDILHILDNLLIVRADRMNEHGVFHENMLVVTRKMKKIGKIKEIFGPVNAPYISIQMFNNINASEARSLKNERVYLQ
jgi:rRNA processing protein Gar1